MDAPFSLEKNTLNNHFDSRRRCDSDIRLVERDLPRLLRRSAQSNVQRRHPHRVAQIIFANHGSMHH